MPATNVNDKATYGSLVNLLIFFSFLCIFNSKFSFNQIGFVYVFNIIVGSGALTMPKAFELTGIILSTALLVFLTIVR